MRRLLPAALPLVLALAAGAAGCRSVPPAVREPAPDAAAHPAPEDARPVAPEPAAEPPPALEPRLALARRVVAERGETLEPEARELVASELAQAEREHGLGVLLLASLVEEESRYRPRAEGPRGALGLMQVRPFVGRAVAERHGLRWEGPATLLDPARNLRIGTAYLAELRDRFGSVRRALAAWNLGPTRLARRLERGADVEAPFAARVLARRDALRAALEPETPGRVGG